MEIVSGTTGRRGTPRILRILSHAAFDVCLLLALAATGLRLLMSLTLHMWYAPEQRADDALLMSYSTSWYSESTDPYRLAKNQSYGGFLRLVAWSGIPVDIMYFLLWLAAAVLASIAVHAFFRNHWLSLFAYAYVLWNPAAFEDWTGTRLYRNSMTAPSLFILLSLFMLLLAVPPFPCVRRIDPTAGDGSDSRRPAFPAAVSCALRLGGVAVLGMTTGLWFAFVYDLKEDSIWLVPMLAFVVLAGMVKALAAPHRWSLKILAAAMCLLPILTAYAGVQSVKGNNERDFGVAVLNTRTQGEMAIFVSYLYMVDDPNQTPDIWAPAGSIEQVFAASPTLSKHPEMLDYLEHRDFAAPDIHEHPIHGDLISWQLLNAVAADIGMDDQQAVQRLFSQANQEIHTAFADGRLHATDKIMPLGSMVPRTPAQIKRIVRPSLRMYANAFLLKRYYRPSLHTDSPSREKGNAFGLRQLNIDLHNPNPTPMQWFTFTDAQRVATTMATTYRIINIMLLVMCAGAAVTAMTAAWRRRWLPLGFVGLAACLGVYGFAYMFFVYWFTEYVKDDYVTFFYAYGSLAALLGMGLLVGAGALISAVRTRSGRA